MHISFRREPTLIISTVAALLGLLVTFNLHWLNAGQAALIVALFNAILGAWNALKVRPIAPAAFTYLVGTAAVLAAAYGLHVSEQTVGAVNGVVLAVLALLTRAQVTPISTPAQVLADRS